MDNGLDRSWQKRHLAERQHYRFQLATDWDHNPVAKTIIPLLQEICGETIIDVGCADGFYSCLFNEIGAITTMTDLSMIKDNEYDAIYSSHNIEHLFAHEVDIALEEFSRVLDNEGEIFITCPDMARAAEEIIKGNFLGVLYESRAGPISAIDILFGHRESLRNGQHHMAHRVGFTLKILLGLLKAHGFNTVAGTSDNMDLYVIGLLEKNSDKLAESKLREHLDGLVKV